jgi:hypothetical protein
MSHLEFQNCDMSGVTEKILTTFLATVAESKVCTTLRINDVKSDEVFSRQALKPIMATRHITVVRSVPYIYRKPQ